MSQQFFDLGDPRANDVCNGLVAVIMKFLTDADTTPKQDGPAILMGLGIASGMIAKMLDIKENAADCEGLDVVNSIAHQVYNEAQIGPR